MHEGIRMTRAMAARAGSSPGAGGKPQDRGVPLSAENVSFKTKINGKCYPPDPADSYDERMAEEGTVGHGEGSDSGRKPETDATKLRQTNCTSQCAPPSAKGVNHDESTCASTTRDNSVANRRALRWPRLSSSNAGSHIAREIALEKLDTSPRGEDGMRKHITPASGGAHGGGGADMRAKQEFAAPGPRAGRSKTGKGKAGKDTHVEGGESSSSTGQSDSPRRGVKRPWSLRSRPNEESSTGPASDVPPCEATRRKRARGSSTHAEDRPVPPAPGSTQDPASNLSGDGSVVINTPAPSGGSRSLGEKPVGNGLAVESMKSTTQLNTKLASSDPVVGRSAGADPSAQSTPAVALVTGNLGNLESFVEDLESLGMYDTFMRAQERLPSLRSNLARSRDMQNVVDVSERRPMVAWICRVQLELGLQPETLHLAVGIMDRTLSTIRLENSNALRALAVSSLHLAIKLEEVEPVALSDLLNCPNLNALRTSQKEVLSMEAKAAAGLQFRFFFPTPRTFLTRFLDAAGWKDGSREALLAEYLAELALTDCSLVGQLPSVVAAACIRLAQLVLTPRGQGHKRERQGWTPALEEATELEYESWALLQTVARLMAVHQVAEHTPVSRGTWEKNATREKRRVSLITSITSDREPFLSYLTVAHAANAIQGASQGSSRAAASNT